MHQCLYCQANGKEAYFKRIQNHLKVHGKTYEEYLREYHKVEYLVMKKAELIFNLFVATRKKYIEQVEKDDKKYDWVDVKSYYSIYDVRKHIEHKKTIGVYPFPDFTYFIVFDIDTNEIAVLKNFSITLSKLGIRDENQLISFSGNKGYHIGIFFEKGIYKNQARTFAEYVKQIVKDRVANKSYAGFTCDLKGVDNSGVKLPLSINRKGLTYKNMDKNEIWLLNTTRYCYLCDCEGNKLNEMNLENWDLSEEPELVKLMSLEKLPRRIIYNVLNDLQTNKYSTGKIKTKINNFKKKKFNSKHIYYPNKSIEKSVVGKSISIKEQFAELLSIPIRAGERHNTIFRLALYYKHFGYSEEKTKALLISHTALDIHRFRTIKQENIRDIERIIHSLFIAKNSNKYRLYVLGKTVSFSRREIENILILKADVRKVYVALTIQCKRFCHNFDSSFFMTYESLSIATGLEHSKITKALITLQDMKKIRIVRKNQRNPNNKKISLPNIYQLLDGNSQLEAQYKLYSHDTAMTKEYYMHFKMLCAKSLCMKDLKKYFKWEHDILRFKYQKLNEIA
jgi:hypothetical protein